MNPVPLRVAVVGLGSVGRAVLAAVASEPTMTLVGGADVDAKKLARAAAEFGDAPNWTDDVETLDSVDTAIVCTGPRFDRVAPTLRQLMRGKVHVVSDCAEMAWPWFRHPHLADVIATEARKAGVALLGTGVWPGVASAALPLALLATVLRPTRVAVSRTMHVNDCRPSVRRRAGLNLLPSKFRTLAREGLAGISGVGEAAVLIAQGTGRHPTRAEVRVDAHPIAGENGKPAAVKQVATYVGGGLTIEMSVTLSTDQTPSSDTIRIDGDRVVEFTAPAGLPDAATAAVLINSARHLPTLSPGLRTILDLLR